MWVGVGQQYYFKKKKKKKHPYAEGEERSWYSCWHLCCYCHQHCSFSTVLLPLPTIATQPLLLSFCLLSTIPALVLLLLLPVLASPHSLLTEVVGNAEMWPSFCCYPFPIGITGPTACCCPFPIIVTGGKHMHLRATIWPRPGIAKVWFAEVVECMRALEETAMDSTFFIKCPSSRNGLQLCTLI